MSEIKNRVGRPRVNSTPITVRMPPKMLAALDRYIETQGEISMTRPEALRQLASFQIKKELNNA